ncbi:MAG: hypothetical protein M1830_006315, partial [Pleopsidium flavum]
MASRNDNKKKRVQSTLSPAFFKPNHLEATETQSPYFSKPNPPTSPNLTKPPTPNNEASPSSSAPSAPSTKHSTRLAHTATETKSLLPTLLSTLPSAPPTGHLYTPSNLPHLDPKYCPRFTLTAFHPAQPG